MRVINKIILHCSASDNAFQDSIEDVKELHTAPSTRRMNWGNYKTRGKGFSDVGYHYYIDRKGRIFFGRDLHKSGAHCKGHNATSIGICLGGNRIFTKLQFESCAFLVQDLLEQFGLNTESVYPHKRFNHTKTCPNFDIKKEILDRFKEYDKVVQ